MKVRRPRRYLDRDLREYVIATAKGRCHYCRVVTSTREEVAESEAAGVSEGLLKWLRSTEAQIDHIVPWSAGGADHPDNLVLACRRCNSKKGVRSYEWYALRRPTRAERLV